MSATTPSNSNARGKGPSGRPSDGVRERLAELRALRDQDGVDLNLADKEARDLWHRIKERIRASGIECLIADRNRRPVTCWET